MKRLLALVVALFAAIAVATPTFAAYPPGGPSLSSSGTPARLNAPTISSIRSWRTRWKRPSSDRRRSFPASSQ